MSTLLEKLGVKPKLISPMQAVKPFRDAGRQLSDEGKGLTPVAQPKTSLLDKISQSFTSGEELERLKQESTPKKNMIATEIKNRFDIDVEKRGKPFQVEQAFKEAKLTK